MKPSRFQIVAIVIVGVFLSGHLPRGLVTGQLSWILWLLAAVVVLGAPSIFRAAVRRVVELGRGVRAPVR